VEYQSFVEYLDLLSSNSALGVDISNHSTSHPL
jgi:hypothetical protein